MFGQWRNYSGSALRRLLKGFNFSDLMHQMSSTMNMIFEPQDLEVSVYTRTLVSMLVSACFLSESMK